MQELEPIQKEAVLPSNNQTTTTLIIDNIPSEIAYKIITGDYARGLFPTKEELKTQYERTVNPEPIDSEIEKTKRNEEYARHTPIWTKSEAEKKLICICKDCGAIIGIENEQGLEMDYQAYQEHLFSERSIKATDEESICQTTPTPTPTPSPTLDEIDMPYPRIHR